MKVAFRMGNIPVRIHGSFLFMTVILASYRLNDLPRLLEWLVVVLVSVLIHEMGHALMGKSFGLAPEIDLHSMGGTTSWSAGRNVSNVKSILISLAGPVTGMIVAQVLALAVAPPLPKPSLARSFYDDAYYVNWWWGVFNLLPMLPLDGGNVLRSLLNAATKGKGETPARIVGIVLAGLIAAAAVLLELIGYLVSKVDLGTWWFAILGLLFATQNYRALKDGGALRADASLKLRLDQAYEALKQKDAPRVLALSVPVIDGARSLPVRAEAIHLAAYGLLLEGRANDADSMIARLPQGYAPHPAYAELRAQVVGRA